MSVASFLCPCNSAVISPAAALVVRDGDALVYRSYTYGEYYDKFWSRSLDDREHCLELFTSTQSGQ
jgi:salicylic acid 3-hydroxylase